jgi:hypothetical protein
VQYVVNGVPLTENRSPAFAPSLDANDVESMRVLTASYERVDSQTQLRRKKQKSLTNSARTEGSRASVGSVGVSE